MLKLTLFVFTFAVAACTSSGLKIETGSRGPASLEYNFDRQKILSYARYILKANEQTRNQKFKVVNYPLRASADLSPGNVESVLMPFYEVPEIQESGNLFVPIVIARLKGWAEQTDERHRLREIFTGGLTRSERDQLLTLCFGSPAFAGETITVGPLIALNPLCEFVGLFHTDAEITEALVDFPAKPAGVRYDGRHGYHVYANPGLEQKVQILTAAISTNLHRFYELFLSQDEPVKEKFRANKDSANEADKVEPYDLLTTSAVRFFIGKNMGLDRESEVDLNKIQVSKLTQKALARMLHMKDIYSDAWRALPNLTVGKSANSMAIMCANGLPDDRWRQNPEGFGWDKTSTGTELIETWRPEHKFNELLAKGLMTSQITCNGVKYKFETEKIEAASIPVPAPVRMAPGQELNALMTVSLVNEIDRGAVEQARKLAGLLVGWDAVGEVMSVSTRDFLNAELVKADAYFPVMHSMDVNYFNIGTEKGLALRLRKVVKDETGADRIINLAVLLPDGASGFDSVILKPKDLAKILHERFLKKPTSLFLMNNSCASEKTLFAWTLVFREALELRKASGRGTDLAAVRDFPNIIASSRNFGTANLGEIFSHAEFPLHSLEMLGQGRSVRDVVDYLKAPPSKGFLGQLGGLFGGTKNSVDKANESTGFEPVFVLDHPELLSLGGFHISVTSENIQGRDQY